MNTNNLNPIYELLEISKYNEAELFYLINLSKQFNIIKKVQEHIFQFSPTFDENGRNQKFSVFYKEALLSEILYFILKSVAQRYIFINLSGKEKSIKVEDYSLYFYNKFLDEKNKNELLIYLLKNNLSHIVDNEEIFNKFYNDNKNYLNDFKKNKGKK